jgi:hypothetical protein
MGSLSTTLPSSDVLELAETIERGDWLRPELRTVAASMVRSTISRTERQRVQIERAMAAAPMQRPKRELVALVQGRLERRGDEVPCAKTVRWHVRRLVAEKREDPHEVPHSEVAPEHDARIDATRRP